MKIMSFKDFIEFYKVYPQALGGKSVLTLQTSFRAQTCYIMLKAQ